MDLWNKRQPEPVVAKVVEQPAFSTKVLHDDNIKKLDRLDYLCYLMEKVAWESSVKALDFDDYRKRTLDDYNGISKK